ncbi:MAG: M20/M25/M40 family metallo-hydrolase [Candidatus Bipolaricaulia bacterium]
MADATLDNYLEGKLDDYIDETSRLCAQPSVSARSEGTHECAGLVGEILEAHGFQVERFETPGNPILVGTMAGASERTLLFYNHYDVQPPEPLELWETPPFQPTVRDGALYARGAKDDKGELIARLAAVDAVRKAHGGTPPCGVKVVIEGEEEIGSPHIAPFVQDHRELLACHGAIWEEGGIDVESHPEIQLGKRGVLAVELNVRTMSQDAHSGGAHILPNAAWRLTRALATLKDADERIRIDGFYDDARAASERDHELFEQLPDVEPIYRDQFGIDRFLRGATGVELLRNVFEPTCNIQGVTTGYQGEGFKTVIPSAATAKLDFRLVPDQDPEAVFEKLRSHLDKQGFGDVEATWLGAMWPERASPDDPFVELTAQAGHAVYGKKARLVPLNGGSSPVYAFARPLDIPVVTCGVGYWDNRVHAPNEHVRLNDFLKASQHVARILDGFADISG